MQKTKLYWRPLGGNNIDQISGHCYQYSCVFGKEKTSILVDLGKFDNYPAYGIDDAIAAVPDIRELLKKKALGLKGLFLTHSHPDHLNGIFHYLRAGYKLPTLYGGAYTKLVLEDMYKFYGLKKKQQPKFVVIKDGYVKKFGKLKIEVISASHTCFDAFGFLITDGNVLVYHSGDMKIDNSTFFKKPTNIKRITQLADKINYVVADFCEIYQEGFAYKEREVFSKFVNLIKQSRKRKIYMPVYPTHIEMYIVAFLSALKLKLDVYFHGSDEFYSYLELIKKYGIDFKALAKKRIKVFEKLPENLSDMGDNFAIIGSYCKLDDKYLIKNRRAFALVTARSLFNNLKKQFEACKIKFVSLNDYPCLRGSGHAFLGDWQNLRKILNKAVFIPTHCPSFVIESFSKLGKKIGFDMINPCPQNNMMYLLDENKYKMVKQKPALWLVAKKDASMTEVMQIPTAGCGMIRNTISRKKLSQAFKMMEIKLEKKNECR